MITHQPFSVQLVGAEMMFGRNPQDVIWLGDVQDGAFSFCSALLPYPLLQYAFDHNFCSNSHRCTWSGEIPGMGRRLPSAVSWTSRTRELWKKVNCRNLDILFFCCCYCWPSHRVSLSNMPSEKWDEHDESFVDKFKTLLRTQCTTHLSLRLVYSRPPSNHVMYLSKLGAPPHKHHTTPLNQEHEQEED